MQPATAALVRELILERLAEQLAARSLTPSDVPPEFDLLLEGLIDSFVGVRAEIIALSLDQIGGQAFRTKSVEIGERRRETERRNAAFGEFGVD